jgi:hypothetical protein
MGVELNILRVVLHESWNGLKLLSARALRAMGVEFVISEERGKVIFIRDAHTAKCH